MHEACLRDEWNRSGLPLNRTDSPPKIVVLDLIRGTNISRIFRLFEKLSPSIWSETSSDIIVVFCERMALLERLLNAWKFSPLLWASRGRRTSYTLNVIRRERACTSNVILSYLRCWQNGQVASIFYLLNVRALDSFINQDCFEILFEFWAGEKFEIN